MEARQAPVLCVALALAGTLGTSCVRTAVAVSGAPRPVASIDLYNPTGWAGLAVVEVPTGSLAAPGSIDWQKVRLTAAGQELPFALREGRAHWKAALVAPVLAPRAEDLLVFSCRVPPGEWLRVDVVSGRPTRRSALRRAGERLTVTYPGLVAVVDRSTGLLLSLRVDTVEMLAQPLGVDLWRATYRDSAAGEFSPWPPAPQFALVREEKLPPLSARLVAQASTAAMTELHFLMASADGLALGVTYRFHAAGVVEILSDERPWQGVSPWVNHAVALTLPLAGEAEALPLLENRAPLYGFKDFAVAVGFAGALHRQQGATLLGLGEETINGRRWSRRLFTRAPGAAGGGDVDLVALADEGLVVVPVPVTQPLAEGGGIRIVGAPEDGAATALLADALQRRGVSPIVGAGAGPAISLIRDPNAQARGIAGDGFALSPAPDGGVTARAGSRFGLLQAASRIAADLGAQGPGPAALPLIAANPIIDLRAGGFGGGDFEVDFPYGDEAEWERVLGALVGSGMNVMGDLGMWSNWKMPVSYRYLPELRSAAADAYDEVSGARFADYEAQRDHGLRILQFLHDRGVRVWLWLPIGAVPTTYALKHPEAMSPGNPKAPCYTHPLYQQYLQAFLKEIVETYPIDGVVMIRDDNGGVCTCDRCKAYVAGSRTRSPAWEQYLILYDHLRREGFSGELAVYPYVDPYEPRLEPLLPADLLVVGHGAGLAVLCRSYERVAPMGDTWIDNMLSGFRLAGSPRMRRLLADRPSFWIGGSYRSAELPWESIGRFGWEPTCTANTLRYEWGRRTLGRDAAVPFTLFSAANEGLWELFDVPMLPSAWMRLKAAERERVSRAGREGLARFRERLEALRAAAPATDEGWLRHVAVFGTFFETHLARLERLAEMRDLVTANQGLLDAPAGLPPTLRQRVLDLHAATYRDATALEREAAAVPGNMMASTVLRQRMMRPYREWGLQPYGLCLDRGLDPAQFRGAMSATATAPDADGAFTLRIELHNRGFVPWIEAAEQRLEVGPEASRVGLPARWAFSGEPLAPGDRRTIELPGRVAAAVGETELTLAFFPPYDTTDPTMRAVVKIPGRGSPP
jgi:hypothetical protein